MAELLRFKTTHGGAVVVATHASGTLMSASIDDRIQDAEASFEDVLATVQRVAASLHDALAAAPVDTAEVEFGLKFSGKGTIFVVEASAEATLSVRLTLKPMAKLP